LGATITLRPEMGGITKPGKRDRGGLGKGEPDQQKKPDRIKRDSRQAVLTLLFGECPGRLLLSVKEKDGETFEKAFEGYPCYRIGNVTGGSWLRFLWEEGGEVTDLFQVSLDEVERSWKSFSKEIIE